MRIGDEVALQLAQYLRCENKQQYDDLQRGRQLNAEVLLDKKRQDKQSQYQQADKRAFIFAADDGRHQRSQYDQPQYGVYGEHGGLPPDDGLQLRAQVPRGLFLTFHSVSLSACHFHFPVLYRKIRRNTIKMTARPGRADLRQASRAQQDRNSAPPDGGALLYAFVTSCRKCGRRHRPDRARCSRARSGDRPAHRHRCPHPGTASGCVRCPREPPPAPSA